MNRFHLFTQTRFGLWAVLLLAASLESYGDSCFQDALYNSAGSNVRRCFWFVAGALVLAAYSLFLNASRLEFGKLLGQYVIAFFVMAQVIALAKYGQRPTPATWVGAAFILTGGLVMTFWR